jgi:hypothetical protein
VKDEAKRTKVDNISPEVGLELRLVKLECARIHGVAVTLDVDGDLGGPIHVANVSAFNVAPLCVDFFVERLN